MPEYDSTLDEIIAATVEAREVIREMHEATRDLRVSIAEARRLSREIIDSTDEKLGETVERICREWEETVEESRTEHLRRFDEEHEKYIKKVVEHSTAVVQSMEDTGRIVVEELNGLRWSHPAELYAWGIDTIGQAQDYLQQMGVQDKVPEAFRARKPRPRRR